LIWPEYDRIVSYQESAKLAEKRFHFDPRNLIWIMPVQGWRLSELLTESRNWSCSMRESEILRIIETQIPAAGDDAASISHGGMKLILTTDMLHQKTDFPTGTTPYTIGWRAVAVSLSDLAAMGARPLGVLLALGDPELTEETIRGILQGARDCCHAVGTQLVGGDLDCHQELTLVSTGIGEARQPVLRRGARPGEIVCVTGELGRTQAGLRLFAQGDYSKANELFRFIPRIIWGQLLADHATSMIDISDGLARSLYQLAEKGAIGFSIEEGALPIISPLKEILAPADYRPLVLFGGEDYELLFTIPEESISSLDRQLQISRIGRVSKDGVLLDDRELPNKGYEH
jgi:thiamine-monophosphate kinase